MRRRIIAATSAAVLALSIFGGSALAADPGTQGQPTQNCANESSSPPGFNTAGFANAANVYANPGSRGGTASGNGHVVAQYDVACFQVSQH